jgi:hypothetical protein
MHTQFRYMIALFLPGVVSLQLGDALLYGRMTQQGRSARVESIRTVQQREFAGKCRGTQCVYFVVRAPKDGERGEPRLRPHAEVLQELIVQGDQ